MWPGQSALSGQPVTSETRSKLTPLRINRVPQSTKDRTLLLSFLPLFLSSISTRRSSSISSTSGGLSFNIFALKYVLGKRSALVAMAAISCGYGCGAAGCSGRAVRRRGGGLRVGRIGLQGTPLCGAQPQGRVAKLRQSQVRAAVAY